MHLSLYQVLVVALLTVTLVTASRQPKHHVVKRSFYELECKGVYDSKYFNRLKRICDDCYSLFREAQLLNLCMAKCFTTAYFKGCQESLYLNDEEEQIDQMIDYVGKR